MRKGKKEQANKQGWIDGWYAEGGGVDEWEDG